MEFYKQAGEYCNRYGVETPAWMSEIRERGRSEQIPIVDDNTGQLLRLLCLLHQPKRILEIGCGISYSTHWMLLGAEQTHIVALDINEYRVNLAKEYLSRSDFLDQTVLHNMSGEKYLQETKEKFDLIFFDSVKREYIDLLYPACNVLNDNGLLVCDNMFYNGKVFGLLPEQVKKYQKGVDGLKRFQEEVTKMKDLEPFFIPVGDGVLVAKKISRNAQREE